jgi:pimeloyl-ACP methyl ester carboxylesterase
MNTRRSLKRFTIARWRNAAAELWQRPPPLPDPDPACSRRLPIYLHAGIYMSAHCLVPLAQHMRQAGWAVRLQEQRHNIDPVPAMAHRLAAAIAADSADQVDVVAHSLGGIIAILADAQLRARGQDKIRRLVTLSTPYRGCPLGSVFGARARPYVRYGADWFDQLQEQTLLAKLIAITPMWDDIVWHRTSLAPPQIKRHHQLPLLGHVTPLHDVIAWRTIKQVLAN